MFLVLSIYLCVRVYVCVYVCLCKESVTSKIPLLLKFLSTLLYIYIYIYIVAKTS